ncbi:hypothetical protein H9L05_09605 [Hymenobacter qilianensis]|uniref:Uncharacterized protein n=1 Tax=Hymenobacter qilianensis TaxID=1385715 RepID=A0A7H0GZP6_9BACT|nr:hypothetical protein [Hymenobacter qilianensis]QNP53762.1 hypothetical protein H9L05_09605 [Hymenobacter qilianensis]
MLTWLSQAEPTEAHPFALRQLWSWLPAASRPDISIVPDTPRTVLPDTSIYRSSRRPKIAPRTVLAPRFRPSAAGRRCCWTCLQT